MMTMTQAEDKAAVALIRVLMDSGVNRDEAIRALAAALRWNLER
jgi:uncharacterized protein YoaH (UPF0181 family)